MEEKPVKNDAGQLSLDEEAKKEAWREHYERLFNVEFPWNPEDLSEESPVEGPSEPITLEMITKAISKMASGKAAGPSDIVAEMLKPVGEAGAVEVRDLIEDIISEGCIPTDWQESFMNVGQNTPGQNTPCSFWHRWTKHPSCFLQGGHNTPCNL